MRQKAEEVYTVSGCLECPCAFLVTWAEIQCKLDEKARKARLSYFRKNRTFDFCPLKVGGITLILEGRGDE